MQQVKQKTVTVDALQDTLKVLQSLFSPRNPKSLVIKSFDLLSQSKQIKACQKVKMISASNAELALVFACQIGKASKLLSNLYVNAWVDNALAVYDHQGLYPAAHSLKNFVAFKKHQDKRQYACSIDEVKPLLDVFIRGLVGRGLSIKPSQEAIYTDTDYLYLPKSISKYNNKKKNIALYKAMSCFLWAQNQYGTFKRYDFNDQPIQGKLSLYKNRAQANALFLRLENIRLLSKIKHDLPGLYREINQLFPLNIPNDNTWKVVIKRLQKADSNVKDSLKGLDVLMNKKIPIASDYLGDLLFDEVERAGNDRKTKIIEQLNEALKNESADTVMQQAVEDFNLNAQREDINERNKEQQPSSEDQVENLIAGLLNAFKYDVEKLSIDNFDFSGKYEEAGEASWNEGDVPRETYHQEKITLPEWDYVRQSYRKDWCQVVEKEISDDKTDFKKITLEKYPYLSQKIRQLFEVMRDQPLSIGRQTSGDEIDIDAVVEMHTALKAEEELSERLYIQRLQHERQVSVCLLVDMSGSTKGWINLAIRESLIMFCDALNIIGDDYSVYGFSGLTRQRCDIYTIKTFEDQAESINTVENKIANIQAKDYTRMGFAVRYAAQKMTAHPSKHQILLLLCDGKPDDYDGYQGEYGIQDTRKAILEAQGLGIKPFSLTIDKQAQQYLPRLFGPGNYTILGDVIQLPLKLSEIYRKLST